MKRVYILLSIVIMILIVLFYSWGERFQTLHLGTKAHKFKINDYIPLTKAFEHFPGDFKSPLWKSNCEVLVNKAPTKEALASAKVSCFGSIFVHLHKMITLCENEEKIKNEINETLTLLEEKISCLPHDYECIIKDIQSKLKVVVSIYRNNVEFCVNKIPYENKTSVRKEMLNYLGWIENVIDTIANYS